MDPQHPAAPPHDPWQDPRQPQTPAPSSDPNDFEPIGDEDIPDPEPQPDGDPSAYVDDQVGPDGTRFEPLEGGLSAKPKIPFSDQEILDGSAMIAMLGAKRFARAPIDTAKDVETFKTAYHNLFAPFVTTADVIAPLHLGEALAEYGIHKNMLPGSVGLEDVPAWIRLTIGALLLGTSTVLAIGAVREAHQPPPTSKQAATRDPLNTDPQNQPGEPEPEPPRADGNTPPPANDPAPTEQPGQNGAAPGQPWM